MLLQTAMFMQHGKTIVSCYSFKCIYTMALQRRYNYNHLGGEMSISHLKNYQLIEYTLTQLPKDYNKITISKSTLRM